MGNRMKMKIRKYVITENKESKKNLEKFEKLKRVI